MDVKDANGCIQRQNFTLTQPGRLIITISRGAAITCAGGTQAITVGSTGGTPPIIGTGVFNELAGTYTLSIHDQFSTADTIITVTEPPTLTLSVSFPPIGVNGGSTTVTGTGGGGTPALQYSLDGGAYQGSPVFAGVFAGVHFMDVKDANNCTKRNNFSISQPTPLTMTATPGTNPFACNGDNTTVTVVGNGGTTPFTYGKNGVFGGSGTFTNLLAGTYTFSVKDGFNAQHDTIITLSQPALITLLQTVVVTPITTYGGTGDMQVVVAGGTPTSGSFYSFALDGGSYTVSTDVLSYTFLGITGGNHTVSIKDASNCVQTYSFFVPQPPPPVQYNWHSNRKRYIKRNG
jgi:hypothetical protein